MSLLDPIARPLIGIAGLIGRMRHNHAVEHATMHILSEALPGIGLVGRSTPYGFYIYGEVPTETVLSAAREGLRRLQAGERRLAVHPNCGTSLVVSGAMAGLGSFIILGRKTKSFWERLRLLPVACAAATLGIVMARPLGPVVQARLSTSANVRSMRITGATGTRRAGIFAHFVRTEV